MKIVNSGFGLWHLILMRNILRWACYFVACHWHWSGWGYWSIEFWHFHASTALDFGWCLGKGNVVAECFLFFLASYQRLAYLALNAGRIDFKWYRSYTTSITLPLTCSGNHQMGHGSWIVWPLRSNNKKTLLGDLHGFQEGVDVRRLHRNVISRSLILSKRALDQADHDERGMDAYVIP